jgi:hypothetical protein
MYFFQQGMRFLTRTGAVVVAALIVQSAIVARAQNGKGANDTAPEVEESDRAAEKIVTGCLVKERDGEYALVNARVEKAAELGSSEGHRTKPDTETAATGTVAAGPASVARVARIPLDGASHEMERLVGTIVQMSGRLLDGAESGASANTAQPVATAGETRSEQGVKSPSAGLPDRQGILLRFSVQSVKKISPSCS